MRIDAPIFTGSFSLNGSTLQNLSAVSTTGSNTFVGNQNVQGYISASALTGSIDFTNLTNSPTLVSGSSQVVNILSSLNTVTASFTPRITNLESKSASVDISITNINSVTASNIARLTNLESTSASVDISITNINSVTASNIARLNNLETKSASVDVSITNINSFTASNNITSLNSKTGSYATTGSNTFFGTQTYSGSVYIANDLVVQGSSSIQYISASSVSIGTNIVQLNTANPSVRFAGLTMIDSGSVGGSGSFLYDSLQDEFIFVHRGNGTNVTSSHFVTGPETYDSLGNETYLTTNILTKGTGKEHLIDSCIFDNGTTTCIKNNLVGTGTITGTTIYGSTITCSPIGCFATSCATAFIGGTMSGTTIYGSTAVCSPVGLFSGCVGIGTTSPQSALSFATTSHIGIATTDASDNGYLSIGGGGGGGDTRGAGIYMSGNERTTYGGQLAIFAGNAGASGFINFNTGECERMRITSGGNVGIATVSPENILTLIKNTTAATENTYGLSIQSVNTNAYTELLLGASDAVDAGIIQTASKNTNFTAKNLSLQPQGGNVLIGTTTNASYKLDVSGSGRFSGALTVSYANPILLINGTAGSQDILQFGISGTPTFSTGYRAAVTSYVIASGSDLNTTPLLTIASTGAATFSSCVTATQFNVSTSGGTTQIYNTGGGHTVITNATANKDMNIQTSGTGAQYFNTAGADRLTIASTGIACFACQVCAGSFYTTGNSCFGGKFSVNNAIDSEVSVRIGAIGNTTDTITCSTALRLSTSNNTAGQGVSIALTAGSTKETGIILAAENTSGQNGDFLIRTYAGGANYPERMRITSGGYLKASNAGTYYDSTGTNHELRQSASDTTAKITATNGSYNSTVVASSADRAATSAYSLYGGWSSNFGDKEFDLRGDGNAYADGAWTGGGADYAEYFEWLDGNQNNEDRRGYSVSLIDNKIKIAEQGEAIIGVISGNPSVVGDAAWNKWSAKHLKDDFGSYILDEEGYRILNPNYDETIEYISREKRPEWSAVGLMGKLRLRKGQLTMSSWIKMRDISDTVEEWLVK